MVFELPLTESRVKPHQVTALHMMVALAMVATGAVLRMFYTPAKTWSLALLIAGLILVGITMFRNRWIVQPKVNWYIRIVELMVVLCLASFFAIQSWTPPTVVFGILAAAVLFAIFWEKASTESLLVRIDEQGVKLPVTARKRQIDWREIEQVLFRFGTLTINTYDNHLFQWTIGNVNFDNEAFAVFCDRQIEQGKQKRDDNDW